MCKVPSPRCNCTSNVRRPTPNLGILAVLLLTLLSQISCSRPTDVSPPGPRVGRPQASPSRIISLAPSVTEVLFALDLGDRLVGVTRFCDYPPEALGKSRVGGYFDVNYEAVLSLEPDLVILLSEHQGARDRLGTLGISTLAVDHSRIEGILDSITAMAETCGVMKNGESLRRNLESRIREIQERLAVPSSSRTIGLSKPRVLVAVGRSLQAGASGEIYISGRDGFYDDLIRLAGGQNAYGEETLKFPAVSGEGLARLDPDIIIEMIPDLSPDEDRSKLLAYWTGIPGLRAAREGRVYILGEDLTVVPGPRFILLLEEMAELIKKS